MFLRCSPRKKDGKVHHSWIVVVNRRVADGRVVQRHVLYLGEINDSQQVAWRRTIETGNGILAGKKRRASRVVLLSDSDFVG